MALMIEEVFRRRLWIVLRRTAGLRTCLQVKLLLAHARVGVIAMELEALMDVMGVQHSIIEYLRQPKLPFPPCQRGE